MSIVKTCLCASVLLVSSVARAEEEPDPQWGAKATNCKTMAQVIEPVADKSQSFTLVREWKEDVKWEWKSDPEKGMVPDYPVGGWLDGGQPVSNQYAVCWLKFTLARGQEYVISLPEGNGCSYEFSKVLDSTQLDFGRRKVSANGFVHYYVTASEWSSVYGAESEFEFYLRIFGGINITGDRLGMVVPVVFQQKSISDVLPALPGSDKVPYDLDVTNSGRESVKDPVETVSGVKYTAYRVQLKANVDYAFYGEYDAAANKLVYFVYPDGAGPQDVPGTISMGLDAVNFRSEMKIRVTKDYTFVFRTWDYVGQHTASVAGMEMTWTVDGKPIPGPGEKDPVSAGVYTQSLVDDELGVVTNLFRIESRIYEDGTTNYCGVSCVRDCVIGYGYQGVAGGAGVITGSTVVAGTAYESVFRVSLGKDGALALDGSVYLDAAGVAKEYFFSGMLPGSQVEWSQSLLKYDPTTQSAAEMGITTPAFASEPAGSVTLVKLHSWATGHNIWLPMVNSVEFNADGDPQNLVSKAYLLDCDFTEEAVSAETAKFVITAFDPESGATVADGYAGGDAYANGTVQMRTALTPGGTYDTTAKGDVSALFYKAYLVK